MPERDRGSFHHEDGGENAKYAVFLVLLWLVLILGGGEHRIVQLLLLCGVVLLYALSRPRMAAGKVLGCCFILLAVFPLLAFLPYGFIGHDGDWRGKLEALGAGNISRFVTPQPWVTLDVIPLYYTGLAVVWWILCQNPGNDERKKLAVLFAVFGGGFVIFSLWCRMTHQHFLLWPGDGTMGPFRSRNQMATLLAVLSIFFIALIHSDWRRRHKRWIFWAAAFCVTAFAIERNYSRAGILLLGFGLLLYGTLFALFRKKIAVFSLTLAVLLVFTALFFLGGGKTLGRFVSHGGRSFDLLQDFRFLVHKDACALISDNFLFGIGLGNFDAVFPVYRSTPWDFRTWHPESDWLWLGADLGFPALIVAAIAAIFIGIRLIKSKDNFSPVRIAGLVGCAQFLLHGCFDISGHEPGTFLVVCFCLLLCWPGPEVSLRGRSFGTVIIVLLIGMGVFWAVGVVVPAWRVGMFQVSTLMQQATQLREEGKFAQAENALEHAKRQAPLDHWIRFLSGRTILGMNGPEVEAKREFDLDSRLEPFSPVTQEDEARDWLRDDPSKAAAPFIRAVERSYPRPVRMGRYDLYLRETQMIPAAFEPLMQYGLRDTDLAIVRLAFLPEKDFPAGLQDFITHDAEHLDALTSPRFFQTVESRAGLQGLESTKSIKGGWLPLARAYARTGDFHHACILVFESQAGDLKNHEAPLVKARAAASGGKWEDSWRDLEMYLERNK
ncbi:MAG: O-antigen ligase family protein [Chthoniobacterales bacterium]